MVEEIVATAWLPRATWDGFSSEVARLNRRADKLGMDWIGLFPTTAERQSFVILDRCRTSYRIVTEKEFNSHNGPKFVETLVEIRVHGKPPCIDGWQFVCTMEHHRGKAPIIFAMPGAEVPKRYRESAPTCDHCKQNRQRVYTVVLSKDNEYRQIGYTCLQDYAGASMEEVTARFDLWARLAKLMGRNYMEDAEYLGGRARELINVEWLLACTASVVKRHGWMSSSKAHDEGKTPTWERAIDVYNGAVREMPDSSDIALAKGAMEWVASQAGSPKNSDYMHNLCAACSREAVRDKNIPLVVSAIGCYRRELKKLEERKSQTQFANEFVGKVKDRFSVELELIRTKLIETRGWGGEPKTCYLCVGRDDQGHCFTWWRDELDDWEVGQKRTLRGTVKEHREWQGQKETRMQRVQVMASV